MITPVKLAPKAFAERFNRIYDGDEVIDTVAKLKEFWLFALDQGQGHREMREYIAQLVFRLNVSDKLNAFVYHDHQLHNMIISWEDFIGMSESPYPDELTDEEYHDRYWNWQRYEVEAINAAALDKKLKTFTYPAAK